MISVGKFIKLRNKLLSKSPNIRNIRAFHAQHNPGEPQPADNAAVLLGFYKARVHAGIKVEESVAWLLAHGSNEWI